MRQLLKARELWFLLPVLFISAFALYFARVESVSAPGKSKMFVSEYEFAPASGRWQEKGYSHRVKVEISHPWPRPKWWGQEMRFRAGLAPLTRSPVPVLVPRAGYFERDYLRSGGNLALVENDGKEHSLSAKPSFTLSSGFRDDKYFFVHYVNATYTARQQTQEMRFRGLYKIGEQPPFSVSRTVRARGEKLRIFRDSRTGVQLLSPIVAEWDSGPGNEILIFMMLRRARGLGIEQRNCPVYDFTVVDARGQTHALPASGIVAKTPDIDESYYQDKKRKMPANEFFRLIDLTMPAKSPYPEPLTLRGKISADDRWPLAFEVKLPPRAPATAPGK